ncbi:MAG: dTDP-4-dehydrorhamnose reductase, partial [Gordonibacter urolithinfaciens]
MRILVTGGNGQLGNELQRILREGRSEIGPIPDAYAGAEIVAADVDELDVTDADAVMAYVTQGGFDLIVNGAAMTNVDGCETAEDAAFRVNAEAPGNLARAAEAVGAKLVQVSTDYVFPGTEPEPRVEDDPTGPVSAYGRTKLAGEERSLAACSRCFVVRTAWLYGYVGKNFVKTMMRLGADRDEVTVVDDQLGNPTSANDLAHEILKIAATENYGVYHCTNEGTCS